MIINATVFQQNVGEYFKLADQGEEIIIQKQRPAGYSYTLKATGTQKPPKYPSAEEILAFVKDLSISKPDPRFKNSLDYQRHVRS